MIRKRIRRKTLLKVGIALLVLALVLYQAQWQQRFRVCEGRVLAVECTELGVMLAAPQIFYANENSPQLLITYGGSGVNGTGSRSLEVDLGADKTRLVDRDPYEFSEYVRLDSAESDFRQDSNMQSLSRPGPGGIATQKFLGIHLRLPVFEFFGFPEAHKRGWTLVDRYTGTIRISVVDKENKVGASIQRIVVNARYLPDLSDIGAWTPDGLSFVVSSVGKGNADVLVLQHAASKGE